MLRNLTSFLECPLIPLVLHVSARVKISFNINLDSPLRILKTPMRSCLFLRSSSVHSFKQYNLYDFPSMLLIIYVNFAMAPFGNSRWHRLPSCLIGK